MNAITRFLATALLLSCNAMLSAHAAGGYILDQKGCKIVNPAPRAEETVTWSGACSKDGLAEGKGTLQWFQSGVADEKYQGDMERGFAHGKGMLTMVDGGRYEGDWAESRKQGEGTYFAPDGSIYKGGWKDDKPHGAGAYRTPEGKVQRGEWNNGKYQSKDGDDDDDDDDDTKSKPAPNKT